MEQYSKIYIAGHQGLVGSALMRSLQRNGYNNLVIRTLKELDLRNQHAVHEFFLLEQPEYVFVAAAKVGGIKANYTYPAEFIYDNIMIATNVIHAAYRVGVKKLLFLGSSCIYPKQAQQPIMEDYLLTGPLEPTNEAYAIAKIAGIKLCEFYNKQYGTQFISAMPTNLYGPYDTFDAEYAHVIPALIAKFHEAKLMNKDRVVVWGSGKQRREFLFVDDLAQALIKLMQTYNENKLINIGTGTDITIGTLAAYIKEVVGYKGAIVFDVTKPDGTDQKLLNVDRVHGLGWKAITSLYDGLKATYTWYIEQQMIQHNYRKEHELS